MYHDEYDCSAGAGNAGRSPLVPSLSPRARRGQHARTRSRSQSTGMVKAGSLKDGWAGTCLLPEELKAQVKLRYDVDEYPFARLAKAALGSASKPSPQLARGLVQARKGSEETALTRRQTKAWKQSAEWVDFLVLYRRFVQEWVLPQFGCDLLSRRAIPHNAPDPYPKR